ncbi:MAG: hypothetical protein H6818_10690 [Phycisphaerales bacterium]|nr:hypothetical protein [Phycisphaerales bacterium]
MNHRISLRIFSVLLVIGIVSPAWARSRRVDEGDFDKSKAINLKLMFKKGRVYFVESRSKIVQKINMGGQSMNTDIDVTKCHRESVEDVADDVGTLGLEYDRMAMRFSMPMMGSQSYDSEGDDGANSADLRKIFEPMLHKPMTMELSRGGDVKSFSGMDKIRDAVSKNAGVNMMWMQMQAAYTNEAAKLEFGDSRFQFIPKKPVSVGDTWSVESTREMPGLGSAATTKTNYKLADIKMYDFEGKQRRVAVIEYEGTVEGAPSKNGPAAGPAPSIDSGTTSGTILFDLKRGMPIRNQREASMKLKMSGGPAGNMAVDVNVTETTDVLSKAARDAQRTESKKKSEGDSDHPTTSN